MNSLTKVAAFLREYHLEEYARGAHIEGFDDLIDLVESSDAEVATLCKTLDMKPGHIKKFQRLLWGKCGGSVQHHREVRHRTAAALARPSTTTLWQRNFLRAMEEFPCPMTMANFPCR